MRQPSCFETHSRFSMSFLIVAIATCATTAAAFHLSTPPIALTTTFRRTNSQLFSTATAASTVPQRQVDQYQEWAIHYGVEPEAGFCLVPDNDDDESSNTSNQQQQQPEQWYAATSTGATGGSRVLYVPGGMILSASQIAQEYDGYVDEALQILLDKSNNNQEQIPYFYMFLKVLVEHERGDESPYQPWLAAMPQKWNTAAAMTEFCLSCLPPYIKKVCLEEREQFEAFRSALKAFEYISPETKANKELLQFAYNVVQTRAFASDDDGDVRMIPMADMLNHGYPANVALTFDGENNCNVVLLDDVQPGQPLHLCYGEPTNPSRLLAKYGFLEDQAPATYCKILLANPSQELLDLGYDPSRLLFYTADGGVAAEVWDVLLYSRLERKPDLVEVKEAFYQAHMTGDEDTKGSIHQAYMGETLQALLRHVDFILAEVAELTFQMYSFDASKHPRLPLLRKHHEMVTTTFQKVRANLLEMGAKA